MTAYQDELYGTYQRLAARLGSRAKQFEAPGVGTSLEETVTMMAYVLGAKDPYLVVLYPESLAAILANKQPEWMESFTEPPEPD